VKARLIEDENWNGSLKGATNWLQMAIDIQHSQIEIRPLAVAHALSPTDEVTLSLFNKQEVLLKHINAWFTQGGSLFDLDLTELGHSSHGTEEPCICEEDIPCYCPHRDNRRPTPVTLHRAESMTLPLPSTVSPIPEEWKILISREASLRVAHANECLQELHKNIAKKSAMYRSNKDLALGKRDRLRTYAEINAVEKDMRLLVKRYEESRWALERLGLKAKYPHLKPITRSDLKAVMAVYKPNARGQRNEGLSWIWTTALGKDKDRPDYMTEMYRVNWIRGKSRLDRWKEEVIMLKAEMDWFVWYCRSRESKVRSWVDAYDSPGHRVYCFRQADMWSRIASRATLEFGNVGVTVLT
ncbi:hypothetical protein FA13DRAFT_1622302, partial [Coprinellus micaceus]